MVQNPAPRNDLRILVKSFTAADEPVNFLTFMRPFQAKKNRFW